MSVDVWGQRSNLVRFDWGPTGAARIAEPGAVVVVVDVLSFTTTVGVAVERGMTVYPAAWRDSRATALADQHDAVLAVGRREAGPQRPWSLSPAAMRSAPVTPRLILPSPNGSSIAAAASGVTVVAASLRNATPVAAWLARAMRDQERPIAVIAAGERWPDGTLRPALEDALGGGAVLSALAAEIGDTPLSPEARAACATYEGTRDPVGAVRTCASGIELIEAGFAADVDVAVEVGKGSCVPMLLEPPCRVRPRSRSALNSTPLRYFEGVSFGARVVPRGARTPSCARPRVAASNQANARATCRALFGLRCRHGGVNPLASLDRSHRGAGGARPSGAFGSGGLRVRRLR